MTELALAQPPANLEAEQALIGAVLLSNDAYETVSWLREDFFYSDGHRRIWRATSRLIDSGKQADLVTVCEALGDDLSKVGGAGYIAGLSQSTPSALNVARYAEIVKDKHTLRELAMVGTKIAEDAYRCVGNVASVLDNAESAVLAIGEASIRSSGASDIRPLLAKVLERIDYLHHREDHSVPTGITSGFVDLDEKLDGLQKGDLIVVAGRPSMGKTAFAMNMVEHVAVECGLPCLVFSMEMSGQQLSNRLLGSMARVDQHKMRRGKLNDEEWQRLSSAMGRLHDAPITIHDAGSLTAAQVRAEARRQRRRHGKLGLVVVDYLQLMEASGRDENRATAVSEMSRSLKNMARELECPVIALSQLSREVEKRNEKRPIMSDLRESGAIEQDADVIVFLYRDEVYNPDRVESQGMAEAIIAKQRNGPIGTIPLAFLGSFTRFENYAGSDPFAYRRVSRQAPRRAVVSVDFKKSAAKED